MEDGVVAVKKHAVEDIVLWPYMHHGYLFQYSFCYVFIYKVGRGGAGRGEA